MGRTRSSVVEEVGRGWMLSSLDERMREILDLPDNLESDLEVKIIVTDAV